MSEQTDRKRDELGVQPLADGRAVLNVRMELLSDTIFGSGFSIPGGEDVAVNQDRAGWPYMKGSTFKGLLRESLQNLLVWKGGNEADLNALMGVPGWDNPGGERRVHLTELILADNTVFPGRPAAPEDCYSVRTFTSLEGGVVKTDTLRTASCIRQGLVFTGLLYCQPKDTDLLKQALLGVKWVGTMRSRGFGRVRVTGTIGNAETIGKADSAADSGEDKQTKDRCPAPPPEGTFCIQYRLRTDSPVLATDMARSWGNSLETLHCIPGSAVRGAIVRRWIETHLDKAEQKETVSLQELLSDGVRFSDVFPAVAKDCHAEKDRDTEKDRNIAEYFVPLPSPIGFYEDKQERQFHSILWKEETDTSRLPGEPIPGCKKAKLGDFCALEDGKVIFWKGSTDSTLRIHRGSLETAAESRDGDDGRQVFETRYLDAGQEFVGSVVLDNPAHAKEIASLFSETLWLGADRYGGFGRCSITKLNFADKPEVFEEYSIKNQEELEKREEKELKNGEEKTSVFYPLYLLLLSPTSMRNENGEPCGLDETALAKLLGVDTVTIPYSAASVSDYSGYNSTWQCRVPGARMYDRGSVFRLLCSSPPSMEKVHAVERSGLGIRRAEGYGQVLFLSPGSYEILTQKIPYAKYIKGKSKLEHEKYMLPIKPDQIWTAADARTARQTRLQWIMNNGDQIQAEKLSRSQIGTIQTLCEKAMAQGGDWQELCGFLDKNLKERGARHGDRFTGISELIHDTMEKDGFLPETMNITSNVEKLKLLCQLFDFSRKADWNTDFSRKTDRKEGTG